MRLNAPKKFVWYISILFALVGVVTNFVAIPVIGAYTFWFLLVGWFPLFLGTFLKGF